MKKRLSILFSFALIVFSSCSNNNEQGSVLSDVYTVIATPAIITEQTRSFLGEEQFEVYHCTSKESPVVADVILSEDPNNIISAMYNNEGEVAFYLNLKISQIDEYGTAHYTAFNEFGEPILSAKYNSEQGYMEITDVFVNDIVTRASVAAWGCNLSIGLCGAIWSTAFGMVSAGAGFAVGLAYTCMAIQFCGDL